MSEPKDMGNVKGTDSNFIFNERVDEDIYLETSPDRDWGIITGKGFELSGDDGTLHADNTTFDTRRYDWQPEKDITAYELAKCMPVVNYMQLTGNALVANTKNMVDELSENCQRHFEIVK